MPRTTKNTGVAPPRVIDRLSKKVEVLQLRRRGWTYERISNKVGVSKSTINDWLTKSREALDEQYHTESELCHQQDIADTVEIIERFKPLAVAKKTPNAAAAKVVFEGYKHLSEILGYKSPDKIEQLNRFAMEVVEEIVDVSSEADGAYAPDTERLSA
jgi:hypothetical protein